MARGRWGIDSVVYLCGDLGITATRGNWGIVVYICVVTWCYMVRYWGDSIVHLYSDLGVTVSRGNWGIMLHICIATWCYMAIDRWVVVFVYLCNDLELHSKRLLGDSIVYLHSDLGGTRQGAIGG